SGLPSNTLWTFSIDWDSDGKSDQVVTGPSGTQVDHVFPAIGSYTVSVVATDPEHRVGAPASQTEHVLAAGLRDDPLASGKTALIIGGTPGVDKIVLTPQDALGAITVTINGVNRGTFTPTGHIFVYGQAGNDVLQEAGRRRRPQRLDGPDGGDGPPRPSGGFAVRHERPGLAPRGCRRGRQGPRLRPRGGRNCHLPVMPDCGRE